MGKNRTRESLIREIANIIVHEIVVRHTNRPESVHFLESEIIEYKGKAERTSEEYTWNVDDKEYIKTKALKIIKEKLSTKYSDVKYIDGEVISRLKGMIKDINKVKSITP